MRAFGLIGYPLSHSFSKKYFADKFLRENITGCTYENFSIPSIELFSSLINDTAFLEGLNVTIPYKQQVIPFLHDANNVVQKIGACNCIKIDDGKLYGYNTDTIGFEQSLKKYLLPHHNKAIILGTGGAAKAIMYVLEKLGIEYQSVGRNKSGDEEVIPYDTLPDDLLRSHTLIINTTPLGMYPEINIAPPINYDMLTSSHYLFDAIYNPAKTMFLQKGEEMGASIQNGLDMLVIQAEESWKIWNDKTA